MCGMALNATPKFTTVTWHTGFFKIMIKNIEPLLKKQLKTNLDLEELQILTEELS